MKNIFTLILCCLLTLGTFSNSYAALLGNAVPSQQTSTVDGSLILKTSAGYLQGFSVTSGAAAGYVLIFDSATVPSNGTVTPKFCYNLPATSTTGATWVPYSMPFTNGLVIVFSTTGCFTKTISATAFISGQVQ